MQKKGNTMKQWYEELFQNYADKYDNEAFTKGTTGEVDFIEKEIGYNKSIKILDIGCGTGRHSIELAKRGYTVTGIDLSESLLSKAKKQAQREGLEIEFFHKDARDFNFKENYDLAIMMCEGAFPLMETDDMNFSILTNVFLSLRKSGKLFSQHSMAYSLFFILLKNSLIKVLLKVNPKKIHLI